jgi:hypothetical protein
MTTQSFATAEARDKKLAFLKRQDNRFGMPRVYHIWEAENV